ncbi:MAG: YCF48-related protein, partial [Cryomorphaceae bacterium]
MKHILLISALLPLSCLFAQQGEWELISHYPTEETIYDVVFLDEQQGFLATEEGLFMSSDGGATWNLSAILTEPFQRIDAKDQTIALIGMDGNSSFSTNGGQFWNTIDLPICATSVDVLGQDTIVFLGKDELLSTTNGGIDWQTDLGPLVGSFYCPAYGQMISLDLGYAIHEETLFRKSGSSASWEQVEVLAIQEFVSFAFDNDSIGVVSLDTGNLRRTEDGGETWAEVGTNFTQSYEYAEYHPSGKYLFANESGHVAWSVDDGQSWNYIWLIEGYFSNDDIEGIGFKGEEMWIVGKHGSLYINTTGTADGWEKQFSSRNNISRISPTEDGHLFFQSGNSFLRYENSIGQFSESILEGFSSSSIDDFEMVTENKGFFITNFEELMVTADGCETWQEYDTGPYDWQNFVEIEFLNESLGFNSQDLFNSVFKTVDGGETWSLSLNNNVTGRIRIVDESVVFLIYDNSESHTFYRSD